MGSVLEDCLSSPSGALPAMLSPGPYSQAGTQKGNILKLVLIPESSLGFRLFFKAGQGSLEKEGSLSRGDELCRMEETKTRHLEGDLGRTDTCQMQHKQKFTVSLINPLPVPSEGSGSHGNNRKEVSQCLC